MIRRRRRLLRDGVLAAVLLATTPCVAAAVEIDANASHIGFVLKTRWGQALEGRFPDPRGEVVELADGRHQVVLQLSAATVEIAGHPAYTRFSRGSGFFDAAEYPRIEFRSEPYDARLLRSGGPLPGRLTIRDVSRREVFTIRPGGCSAPARACDVIATGVIHRGDYGMGRWNVAVSDQVRFQLRVRVLGSRPEA
jgi:polyisoprenoid-binding protein YceI